MVHGSGCSIQDHTPRISHLSMVNLTLITDNNG